MKTKLIKNKHYIFKRTQYNKNKSFYYSKLELISNETFKIHKYKPFYAKKNKKLKFMKNNKILSYKYPFVESKNNKTNITKLFFIKFNVLPNKKINRNKHLYLNSSENNNIFDFGNKYITFLNPIKKIINQQILDDNFIKSLQIIYNYFGKSSNKYLKKSICFLDKKKNNNLISQKKHIQNYFFCENNYHFDTINLVELRLCNIFICYFLKPFYFNSFYFSFTPKK